MIGKRINERYKLIRPVGSGGMADVYLAKDLILDRHVAVKMLKAQFSQDEEFIRRFHREAEAATSLSQQHIVSIYDVGEEEDLYYIVMEYIEGQTLKEYIQEYGPLSVEETIRILRQMASGVSHAHANHIIHRDVKPQNILMSVDGVAKVTDFGIARAISEATITHTNSILGSVHYLSPEQARGGQVTYKSDLYALGVIVYEMLTGGVPFKGDTAVSIALKHLQEPLPSVKEYNPDIPQSVENMIAKLTAKDPADRFDSAEDLIIDLETILESYRMNEAPVSFAAYDEEATKGIPVIPGDMKEAEGNTRVHSSAPKEDAQKKKQSKKRKWAFIIPISLLLAVLLAVLLIPGMLRVDEVEVPDISGLQEEEAAAELEELELEVDFQYREDDTVPGNHVISSRPDAGTSVKIGSTIILTVSEDNPEIDMENLLGMDLEDAEELLEEFSSVSLNYEETTRETEGIILNQNPSPGSAVNPEETEVELTVSERVVYTIGNLYGMSRQEVLDTVGEVDYLMLSFDEDYSSYVQEGHVMNQDPARGTEITERTNVNVTFSRGPEPEEETDLSENNEENTEENTQSNTVENENVDSNNNANENNDAGEDSLENQENQETSDNEETGSNENEAEEEELSPVSADVPFSVQVPESEEESSEYRVQISVRDDNNDEAVEVIDETITETTEYQVPMTLAPGETGSLILFVNEQEFDASPYEYTYEELQQFE